MGHPWISECIAVVRKHPNVYADVSALTPRPHQFRSALIEAAEYGCAGKLLFGTDWPFGTIDGHVRLLEQWRDDDDAPEPLRAAAAAVLVTDPLAVLGL
jgi:predicted TIM-barrel fold metal-dependent hydrolase